MVPMDDNDSRQESSSSDSTNESSPSDSEVSVSKRSRVEGETTSSKGDT